MDIFEFVLKLLNGGLGNLAAYLAAHVLLCLLPAFYIAGAMTALVPRDSITRFLGRKTPKLIAYPAAALAGSVLAVCSCTIVPLFAGIYKKGAGIGPAITFLFFAPAANILALIYTGGIIGVDLALARLILSLIFGIGVGLIMALLFSHQDMVHDEETDVMFTGQGSTRRTGLLFLLLLVVLLLVGTFKFEIFTHSYAQITLPIGGADRFQDILYHLVPYDSTKGQEGVSVQGTVLIGLLILIGAASWKGIETIHDGFNTWTWITMILIAFTLLIAALGAVPHAGGLDIRFTGRFFAVFLVIALLSRMTFKSLDEAELRDWLWESWRFVKQIFPLLVIGVFGVGIIRVLIQPEWIESLAGSNTILGNLSGVLFGVFIYFPTLVEVPIASMFLSLGMHRGPLLAYLMADPELSLQSILMISVIIGRVKAWTYVGWVAVFSTLAGLIYGAWIDGVSLAIIAIYLFSFVTILGFALWLIDLRKSLAALPQKI